jgi:hypothetical protein
MKSVTARPFRGRKPAARRKFLTAPRPFRGLDKQARFYDTCRQGAEDRPASALLSFRPGELTP